MHTIKSIKIGQSLSFEKINKSDKSLARLITKGRKKTQITDKKNIITQMSQFDKAINKQNNQTVDNSENKQTDASRK